MQPWPFSPPDPPWGESGCRLGAWEVARRCRALGELVFLDSALSGPDSVSIVAAAPFRVLEGTDWNALEPLLSELVFSPQNPAAAALGGFKYEGGFRFGLYDRAAICHHGSGRWIQLGGLLDALPDDPGTPGAQAIFEPELDRARFLGMVARAQELIAAGDIYQVNLSHRFGGTWSGDPLSLYGALRAKSPKPYAALIDAGTEITLCASPELFLDIRGRDIVTRPIKGTRPRFADAERDRQSREDLLASPKERAELLMITDLERNDLGRVCATGSVEVAELFRLEAYEQVFHLVSTVRGRLREGITPLAALAACFPGGSITGAPKKRAMEIIRELEPVPRGIYTGAIGGFGLAGRTVFNIAIRTAQIRGGHIGFHAGAGIVADSVPEAEYQETLDKAAGLLAAAEAAGRNS